MIKSISSGVNLRARYDLPAGTVVRVMAEAVGLTFVAMLRDSRQATLSAN